MKTKVFIVDDHSLFREGLHRLLDLQPDLEVTGEAANGQEAIEMLAQTAADVVLMDIDMPVMNGIEASKRALEQNPKLKIIALSMHGDREYYFEMVAAGAKGFLLKSSDISEVTAAIDTVMHDGSFFSQELLCSLVGELRPASNLDDTTEPLSERETEVLILICQGLSNQEIADKLFISKRTVDKHRANILFKTGCRNTANLVYFAIKHALIEL